MIDLVFFDTNVLLDVLLARKPFVEDAQKVWDLAEQKRIRGVVSATSFVNVYYLMRKHSSKLHAERAVRIMLAIFHVEPVDRDTIIQAIESGAVDFEDAVQAGCALRSKSSCILTRDARHFISSPVPSIAPDVFLAQFDLS